jgi:1-hydroxycarotenoid 3,4-desaturase
MRKTGRVVVIGAGIGGLVAAFELAVRGLDVTVIERATTPGGKLREVIVGGRAIDAGPTVFTMRWVFEQLFDDLGETFSDYLTLHRANVLARHAWSDRERLDLFADLDRSAEAIGDFAGAREAKGFRAFAERARAIYATLERPFIASPGPTPVSLALNAGFSGLGDLWRISPFQTLWRALGSYFHDPRLHQLFGRYATYCGSSPFEATATLMLVAHVEQAGVWLIEGGMHRLAEALADRAKANGAAFRFASEAQHVHLANNRASAVTLATGETLEADAVLLNADVAAIAAGKFGEAIRQAVPALRPSSRSLSALTFSVLSKTEGFPLSRHNMFFSHDYRAEFDDIFARGRLPKAPTVYVCAQDRSANGRTLPPNEERLFCLVNAPPAGDRRSFDSEEIEPCRLQAFALMQNCGLKIATRPETTVITTPADFERLYPATGGALYGQASHGWTASFTRPGARTKIPGLYLAGGSTHPGPGVPMAALSGRLAAASILKDLASAAPSRRGVMLGGMSMA